MAMLQGANLLTVQRASPQAALCNVLEAVLRTGLTTTGQQQGVHSMQAHLSPDSPLSSRLEA